MWGLKHSLIYGGTCYWQGSTSNVSGPAVHCSEQSSVYECLPLALACVPCKQQCQLPTTATTNTLVNGPTIEVEESRYILCRLSKWSRDLCTRKFIGCHWHNNWLWSQSHGGESSERLHTHLEWPRLFVFVLFFGLFVAALYNSALGHGIVGVACFLLLLNDRITYNGVERTTKQVWE